MTNCASVPTTISESAVATRSQIEASAANNARPIHNAASAQVSVIAGTSRNKNAYVPARSGVLRRHHQRVAEGSERDVVLHVVELACRLLRDARRLRLARLGAHR